MYVRGKGSVFVGAASPASSGQAGRGVVQELRPRSWGRITAFGICSVFALRLLADWVKPLPRPHYGGSSPSLNVGDHRC